jgi:hypothetical protein
MNLVKVLVCGSRDWSNWAVMQKRLAALPPESVLVHGACRGADLMADWLAKYRLHLKVKPYPASWRAYGRGAGPIRNRKMYDAEKPALVLAFHADLSLTTSKGTRDMVEYAISQGTTCEVHSETEYRIAYPDQLSFL